METSDKIEHEGVISRVTDKSLFISLIVNSSCGTCHAREFCGPSESGVREIEVNSVANGMNPGDHVVVRLDQSGGILAMFLAYFLPFILMVAVLASSLQFTENESLSGLLSIGILAPYYALLFVFRNKLKQKFTFTLKKII